MRDNAQAELWMLPDRHILRAFDAPVSNGHAIPKLGVQVAKLYHLQIHVSPVCRTGSLNAISLSAKRLLARTRIASSGEIMRSVTTDLASSVISFDLLGVFVGVALFVAGREVSGR